MAWATGGDGGKRHGGKSEMLAMRGGSADGKQLIVIVLEPENIEKLKQGQPIHKYLNEFMPELRSSVELLFAYTPDMEWLVGQIGKNRDMEAIATAIQDSLARPEVVVRGRSAEELKRMF
jgi:hypothetical protein